MKVASVSSVTSLDLSGLGALDAESLCGALLSGAKTCLFFAPFSSTIIV